MFKEFPVFDQSDFELISFSATKWDDGTYSAHIDFFKRLANEEGLAEGMTFITQIYGETLKELHDKLGTLIDTGMLVCENIDAHGMLFDEQGNEIDTICWNMYSDDFESELITAPGSSMVQ